MTPFDQTLEQGLLQAHLQPIVSLKQRAIIGLEALARPSKMSVAELFAQGSTTGRMLELDRLCRRKAFEAYQSLVVLHGEKPLLFFNFEASVLDQGVVGSTALQMAVKEAGLQPQQIVIEINESKVRETDALVRFVDLHRDLGFLIALDDLGAGHSNLPRIAQLRPNIIKLDRSLIEGVDRDFFKQKTVKSIADLGQNIGCLILAEGVETANEVDTCALLGAQLFQGYYFSRAKATAELDFRSMHPTLLGASDRLRESTVRQIQSRRIESQNLQRLAENGRDKLRDCPITGLEELLKGLVESDPSIEACYLLDEHGTQITQTHLSSGTKPALSHLFAPALRGADHSGKEYFFSVADAELERYTTDSYLSLATGNVCRTIAIAVQRGPSKRYVYCLDMRVVS